MSKKVQYQSSMKFSKMHPAVLRVMHWTNAISMVIMIMSGWKIYNDEVIFGFLHFPDAIVLGGTISNAFQTFFPELRREMSKLENYNKVFKAKLKDKAGILGAASSFVAQ